MTALRILVRRLGSVLGGLFFARRPDRALEEEIASHIERLTTDYLRRGLPAPEARAAAYREFGAVEPMKERYRDQRGVPVIDHLIRDVRYGARGLRRSPGFAIMACLTLALGVGANSAIFSIVNALLFQPLPVASPDRLTVLARQSSTGEIDPFFSYPELELLRARVGSVAGLVAERNAVPGITAEGMTGRIAVSYVSDNYFTTLGLRPAIGQLFQPAHDASDAGPPVIVLTDAYWRRDFGADPSVVGRTVALNGSPVTVIGVTPRGFYGDMVFRETEGFLPLALLSTVGGQRQFATARGDRSLRVLALLEPRTSIEQANATLGAISIGFASEFGQGDTGLAVRAFPERLSRPSPRTARPEIIGSVFFAALAFLVLLLACLNVANLLLVRASSRRRELALRASLGAGRWRLVSQLLAETLTLSALACFIGLVIGQSASGLLGSVLPGSMKGFATKLGFTLDWRIFAFALGATWISTIVAGTLPALRASRVTLAAVMNTESAGLTRRRRARGALVVLQIAGSVVVMVVAGLFTRSLAATKDLDFGFDPRGVTDFTLETSATGADQTRAAELQRNILERVGRRPGVEAVALATAVPMTSQTYSSAVVLPDVPKPSASAVFYNRVSAGYFETLRLPVVSGRTFSIKDDASAPPVAVINEAMAQTYWPDQNPIGRHFRLEDPTAASLEIVGVSRTAKDLSSSADAVPFFYLPLVQHPASTVTLHVRSRQPSDVVMRDVRAEIRAAAPEVPVVGVQLMRQSIDDAADGLYFFRFDAMLAWSLGLLGFGLAVVGVYGVVSYAASQRTREIGIRLALGASPRQIRQDILGVGGRLAAAGVSLGLLLAALLSTLTAGLYFGVEPRDPLTFVAIALAVSSAALLASYLPARRAMRVDPMTTLRQEG